MNRTPFFSIVIPFKNAERTIGECLEGIKRQTFKSCEFIFVDNVSGDRSPDLVRHFIENEKSIDILYLLEKKPGASAARNTGVGAARGQWIVFTDSDCIISENWLDDYTNAITEDSSCAAFAGCIKPAATGNIVSKLLGMYTLPANETKKTFYKFELAGGGFPTANFAVRKDVFDAIAGFNEKVLVCGEDYDLCARIYRSENHITRLSDAIIHHIHREDVKGLFRQSYGFGKSHAYCLRHLVAGVVIVDLPLFRFEHSMPSVRIWIDLVQLEKKIYFLILLSLIFPPVLLPTFLFLAYITRKNYLRGKQRGLQINLFEAAYMTYLLLVKSIGLGAGRIAGSFEYKVLCI